ncbi:hypothetical protein B7486_68030, partial [cyanobacterium TDX16]
HVGDALEHDGRPPSGDRLVHGIDRVVPPRTTTCEPAPHCRAPSIPADGRGSAALILRWKHHVTAVPMGRSARSVRARGSIGPAGSDGSLGGQQGVGGGWAPMGTHQQWIERDAAVVWHGFTQMSVYGDNTPVVVERAEGREVVDPDGNRYFDAISSLWVTTLGHRVPELDEALKAQVDKVAHSTMLGNGNTTAVELAEALVPRLPVDRAHLLFSSDGAAAVEQALRIAFQHWTNQGIEGRTSYLALG